MGDRRKLLGTGAVLVGVGTALFSANGVAAADSDADTAPQADAPSTAQPAKAHRGANRAKPAPATTATTNDAPAGAARATRPAAAIRVEASKNSGPAPQVSAPKSTPLPSSATAAPSAATAVADPEPVVAAPVAQAAPVVVSTPVRTTRGIGIQTVATTAPAATAAAAVAPVKAFLNDVLSALGWGPAGAPTAAIPALGAFTGQRASAAPAAVIGAPVVAAAPPNPTPEAALQADGPVVLNGGGAQLPGFNNGVTGVQIGHSRLEMPGALIGNTVAADWYIPTQADGSVDAQGVIYLQHGFAATNTFYSALAQSLAMRTNSIVVAPTLSSIPFTLSGGCLICASSQQAAAGLFLETGRTTLVQSALDAGLGAEYADQVAVGTFVVAGHSAGGGFATAMASDYVNDGDEQQDSSLVGVLMYDGVSNDLDAFGAQVQTLLDADKPVYTIAAPAQAWNAFGGTTNALAKAASEYEGGRFAGAVLTGGSHIDSMLGVNPLFDTILQLVAGRSPAGNTAAVYTLGNGWINDMYQGLTPNAGTTEYGFYAGANEAIVMGPTSAWALPTPVANQLSLGDQILTTVIDAVGGLFGFSILPTPFNNGPNGVEGVIVPALSNGVTGVRVGSSTLIIPSGEGYNAPADWYFPTQADGSVQANGVVWLQHGFLGFKDWYAAAAQSIAQETNSIVVVPNIFWFDDAFTGVAAAQMFLGTRSELNVSANAAGFQGALPQNFVLTGHSAGGRFATTLASTYVGIAEGQQLADLLGVVMFDGVSRPPTFTDQLAVLAGAGVPDYQIAAPPQRWNAYDVATEAMSAAFPDRFNGLQIVNGSHTDVIAGFNLFGILGDLASGLIVRQSPPGAKEAVRTLATGWINDIYAGNTTYATNPGEPLYGVYGRVPGQGPQDYSGGNQFITMGQATASTLPAPLPVELDKYAGTWYEQGSVRQFFSIGLVNTSATYTALGPTTIKVENSGNYFFNNGPQSTITGSAEVVNSQINGTDLAGPNTRLNVGFFFGEPNGDEPGNYWILETGPVVDGKYSYAIVSDPSLASGYILTRDKIIDEAEYNALLDRAKLLGIRGPILRTRQFPPADPGAAVPGPGQVPASVTV